VEIGEVLKLSGVKFGEALRGKRLGERNGEACPDETVGV
jgi:hypothetical protein